MKKKFTWWIEDLGFEGRGNWRVEESWIDKCLLQPLRNSVAAPKRRRFGCLLPLSHTSMLLVPSRLFSSLLVSSSPKTQMAVQRIREKRKREIRTGKRSGGGITASFQRGTSLLGFRFSVGSESEIGN